MYIPKHFKQNDVAVQAALVRDNPLAAVIAHTPDGLSANHIPLLLEIDSSGQWLLQGHVATSNQLAEVDESTDVLVIFTGPNAYISPNWYPSKKDDGRAVPTWNYTALHVSGRIRLIEDDEWKLSLLQRLTLRHEEKFSEPWLVEDAPDGFIDRLSSHVVGLEIRASRIDAKWKASQNQPDRNRRGVYNGLTQSGHPFAALLSSTD
jgi:transcriptional regulator